MRFFLVFLPKSLETTSAMEWKIVFMRHHMISETLRKGESFGASIASIWFVTRVFSHMSVQVTLVISSILTLLTFESFGNLGT